MLSGVTGRFSIIAVDYGKGRGLDNDCNKGSIAGSTLAMEP